MEQPAEIEVTGFAWDFEPAGNVEHLARHKVMPGDIYAVLSNEPLFFANAPGRTASHVMVGPDERGRILYIALLATDDVGIWKPITGWESRLARRVYNAKRVT